MKIKYNSIVDFCKYKTLIRKLMFVFWPKYMNIRLYTRQTGKKISIDSPGTFSEKIRWIMLNMSDDKRLSYCADKYNVRNYVKRKQLGFLLNEVYGVYNTVGEIDFDRLPEQFVLKCTHGSAYNIICKCKRDIDIGEISKRIKLWQREQYGFKQGEFFYNKIKPRILCEKYLEDKNGELLDYKIHCFNGEPKMIQVDFDRFSERKHTRNFYDTDWNDIRVSVLYPRNEIRKLKKPAVLNEMLDYAAKLAKGFPLVRVDFYIVDDKVIFGEMTFTHGCGLEKILPSRYDVLWGSWINLPEKECKNA